MYVCVLCFGGERKQKKERVCVFNSSTSYKRGRRTEFGGKEYLKHVIIKDIFREGPFFLYAPQRLYYFVFLLGWESSQSQRDFIYKNLQIYHPN